MFYEGKVFQALQGGPGIPSMHWYDLGSIQVRSGQRLQLSNYGKAGRQLAAASGKVCWEVQFEDSAGGGSPNLIDTGVRSLQGTSASRGLSPELRSRLWKEKCADLLDGFFDNA